MIRNTRFWMLGALIASIVAVGACSGGDPAQEQASSDASSSTKESTPAKLASLPETDRELVKMGRDFFGQLPEQVDNPNNPITDKKVALGKMLYFDARLSKSGNISCNSCHNIAQYGVDNLPVSLGHGWQPGDRNSPSVLNAALHTTQFWDGRAADVEEQAKGPVLNPVEMAIPHEGYAEDRIASIPQYQKYFAQAFPDEQDAITYDNIARAIGAFERTLMTPSRFDAYLQGDADALTALEKKGMETFINSGCTSCHSGKALGGESFRKFGMIDDYWKHTHSEEVDPGRYKVTKDSSDLYFFKVPSLRNVAQTYPYFHDGSVWDLDEAVRIMAKIQLGQDLTDQQTKEITAFLGALTGEVPQDARQLPMLPPSGSETSKPVFN